jgi:hypothetical protein
VAAIADAWGSSICMWLALRELRTTRGPLFHVRYNPRYSAPWKGAEL